MGKVESAEMTETVQYTVKSQTRINRDCCERDSNRERWSEGVSRDMTVETSQVC